MNERVRKNAGHHLGRIKERGGAEEKEKEGVT